MMSWTPDRIERLRKLCTHNLTAAQIAAELGGVTRNGVIGKLHRLGISTARPQPRPTRTAQPMELRALKIRAMKARHVESEPAPAPMVYVPPPAHQRVPLVELNAGRCHWPFGDPGEPGFGFCGAPVKPERPYCAHHWRVAHEPPGQERRRKAYRE